MKTKKKQKPQTPQKKSTIDLGPKGMEAFETMKSTMSKFRAEERYRMVGYLQVWLDNWAPKKKRVLAQAKHA